MRLCQIFLFNPLFVASICFLNFHFFGNGLLVDDIRPSSYEEEIMPPPFLDSKAYTVTVVEVAVPSCCQLHVA